MPKPHYDRGSCRMQEETVIALGVAKSEADNPINPFFGFQS
jgi:hypothetical protein